MISFDSQPFETIVLTTKFVHMGHNDHSKILAGQFDPLQFTFDRGSIHKGHAERLK
jgi:hypothetical protein